MDFIVTGNRGFIGSALQNNLELKGHNVFGYDLTDGIDLIIEKTLNLPKVDAIFHLAATNGTKHFYNEPSKVLKNNTLLTFVFDEYLEKYPDTTLLFASTCEIFNGATEKFGWEIPTKENVPVVFDDIENPRWSYSLPKALAENYYLNKHRNTIIIRYFNIIGEEQKDHFIDEFIHRCLLDKKYEIYGNDTRSFCYIDDAIEMTINLLSACPGIYNIGNPIEVKISEVASLVLKNLSLSVNLLKIYPGKKGSASRRCPSIEKYNKIFQQYDYTSVTDMVRKITKHKLGKYNGVN